MGFKTQTMKSTIVIIEKTLNKNILKLHIGRKKKNKLKSFLE
jgi:hypothetical protein